MLDFDSWLFSITLFPICLGALILIFKRGRYQSARILLGIAFLIIGWFDVIFIVIESGILIKYPYLFRIGMPFYYLVPPFVYLYVSAIIYNKSILSRINLLHLIPFLLALIDLSKYLLGTDMATKAAEIYLTRNDKLGVFDIGSGFIPAISHYYFRAIQSLVYLFLQWRLIVKIVGGRKALRVHKWVVLLTLSETIMYAGNTIFTIGVFYRRELDPASWLMQSYYVVCYLMLLAFFSPIIYLLFTPDSLLGSRAGQAPNEALTDLITESVDEDVQKPETVVSGPILRDVEQLMNENFLQVLNDYMEEHKPYLTQRVTIRELATTLNLSHHLLSAFINHSYQCNFNEYINGYRIDYILGGIKNNPAWRQFSIEGLATEAGFSSRSAFYLAFKKKTGISPATYIADL